MRAYLSALRWRLRAEKNFQTKFLHLLDSQVSNAVLAKHRSGSRQLNRIARKWRQPCGRAQQEAHAPWLDACAQRQIVRAEPQPGGRWGPCDFNEWRPRHEFGISVLHPWPQAVGAADMDQQICAFIEHLWIDGEGRNLAGDALSGI
eukprot:4387470-Pyramimonas_sp.AAC.1